MCSLCAHGGDDGVRERETEREEKDIPLITGGGRGLLSLLS